MFNLKISDLCITDEAIPQVIADKLLYHMQIGKIVSNVIGHPIWASQKSGYRSYKYEVSRGRSGTSQHCFRGKGAIDWSCEVKYLDQMVKAFINSPYNRICYYPNNGFIHADFKYDGKHFFICRDGRNWIRQKAK